MAAITSASPADVYAGVTQVRKLLSIQNEPPIDEMIRQGAVPILINLLKREDLPKVQFEAAWALTNIASGSSAHTQVVVDAGAVPVFVTLLSSPDADVREQAVWCLGNVVRVGGGVVRVRHPTRCPPATDPPPPPL